MKTFADSRIKSNQTLLTFWSRDLLDYPTDSDSLEELISNLWRGEGKYKNWGYDEDDSDDA